MIVSSDVRTISVGDVEIVSVDFTDWLDSDETINTVTVTEVTSSDLTISGASTNTAVMEILGEDVAIGKAGKCFVSGQLAAGGPSSDGLYTVKFTVTTTESRTLNRGYQLQAE